MANALPRRPESPVSRIAAAPFEYCTDCKCDDCEHLFSHTFCPRCSCSMCAKDPNDPLFIPEHENSDSEKPLALGKRKNMFPISPLKRIKADSLNTAVKKLANAAAITAANATLCVPDNINRFCLLSLSNSAEDCLQTCHIVPRALGEDDLQMLEFSWDFPYYGLYLHSRYNLITLTPGLHASFDKGSWALVPLDDQCLNDLIEFFVKKKKWRKEARDVGRMQRLYNGAESFKYALLALPHEVGMRKPLIRSWTTATSVSDLPESHYFPYDTLPIIHSHIRPHFVIYNLGVKLSGIDDWPRLMLDDDRYLPLTSQHRTLLTCIQQSMKLYRAWTCEKPPSNFGPDAYDCNRSGGADTGKFNKVRSTSSRIGSKKSGQGGQRAGESGGGSGATRSDLVDDKGEIYPDDSLTLAFEAASEQDEDDLNKPPDDEHADEESDECFYVRLNTWVSSVPPGPPPLPPASAHAIPKRIIRSDTDSEDGSTTLVESRAQLALEKVGVLSSDFYLTHGIIV